MMHRYLCLFLIVALAGCSSPAAHLVGKSPAMAALCAKPDDIQGTIDAAQEHCEKYGKSAELIGSAAGVLGTSQECRGGDGDFTGKIVHFRCVKD